MNIDIKGSDKKLELTIKQVRVLCEAMWDFKKNIQESPTGDCYHEKIKELKINEIDELFNLLQDRAEYNFERQLDKCHRKKANTDIGEEAMTLIATGYKK